MGFLKENGLRSLITLVKSDILKNKNDITALNTNLNQTNSNVSSINSNITTIQNNINTINSSIEEINNTISNIGGGGVSPSDVLNIVYPVGSIYMSTSDVSPATFIGGLWEQLKDTFLLACGDTYSNGSTGGEAEHTLTVDEMPSHSHDASTDSAGAHTHSVTIPHTRRDVAAGSGPTIVDDNSNTTFNTSSSGDHSHTVTINNTGSGQAHNNMPPYLAVYVWKRTG